MNLEEAKDLAARTLAAIDAAEQRVPYPTTAARVAADRERVASDLAGLRDCWSFAHRTFYAGYEAHIARYADGLRLTANLYGVK